MLSNQSCEACKTGSPKITDEEVAKFIKQVPNWACINESSILKLRCEYQFENYNQALHFTNQVASLAEQENHHPQIVLEWGRVTVTWWTHAINGLHKNDFIMAAKTDKIIF